MISYRSAWSIFFVLFLALGCKKKSDPQQSNPVPSVPVQILLYPSDPIHFNLQAVGGWEYVNGGINGILVYRKTDKDFVALERTSSYLPDNPKARAIVQSDNFTLRDTVSNSKWRIIDGTILNGPAQWPLRLYTTTYDGNALRINN